jgi:hypothetical protein
MNLIWDQKQNQEQPLLEPMAGKTLTHSVYANLPTIGGSMVVNTIHIDCCKTLIHSV